MKKSSTRQIRASTATMASGETYRAQREDRREGRRQGRWQEVEIEYTHHGPIVAHKDGKAYAMAIPVCE